MSPPPGCQPKKRGKVPLPRHFRRASPHGAQPPPELSFYLWPPPHLSNSQPPACLLGPNGVKCFYRRPPYVLPLPHGVLLPLSKVLLLYSLGYDPKPSYASGGDTLRWRFVPLRAGLGFYQRYAFYPAGHGPKPSYASGGAPFLLAERGERPPKGRIPFGNPHGQTHSGLRLRGTKGRSRLRNRSLVALIGCLRRICMWSPSPPPSEGCGWHTSTRKANTLWASP